MLCFHAIFHLLSSNDPLVVAIKPKININSMKLQWFSYFKKGLPIFWRFFNVLYISALNYVAPVSFPPHKFVRPTFCYNILGN
jgi:hypothetical protein